MEFSQNMVAIYVAIAAGTVKSLPRLGGYCMQFLSQLLNCPWELQAVSQLVATTWNDGKQGSIY